MDKRESKTKNKGAIAMGKLDYETIKQEFRIDDVARQLGIELKASTGGNYRSQSIFDPGNNDTCTCYYTSENRFYDFKTKMSGTVLDLVAQVKYGSLEASVINQAAKFLAGDKYQYDEGYWQKRQSQKAEFEANVERFHEDLLSDNENAVKARKYLSDRRITDETIARFKIGLCYRNIQYSDSWFSEPRLYVPYLDRNNRPVYGVHRRLDWCAHSLDGAKYMKEKTTEFLQNGLLGINTLDSNNKKILCIGEGVIDWLSLAQEGYTALFSAGGSFGKDNERALMEYCKKYRLVILCYDTDKAGQNFTIKLGMKLLKAGVNFLVVKTYGEGKKDVSDYYAAGGDFEELFAHQTERGALFIAKRLNMEFGCAQLCELSIDEQNKLKTKVREFIQLVKDILSDNDYKAVKDAILEFTNEQTLKEAAAEPTEKDIINERRDEFIADNPHLFFHGEIKRGTYYNCDKSTVLWKTLTDSYVQHMIAERFLFTETPKRVRDITDAVRMYHTWSDDELPEFNRQAIMSFRNGVFDLKTGELRKRTAEDYVTYQLPYDYDKHADCPRFKQFLMEVLDNNESRLDTIRDMLGYILYTDCSLEKMFILFGEGDNGKGVLVDTLAEVFGGIAGFISAVGLNALSSSNERYMLKNSRLNIVTEQRISIGDNGETIKKLCTGDLITGNLKFKDPEKFRSIAKLVCSCNEIPTINDNSFGMRRRLIFVEFVRKFTNCKDTQLREKLKSELAGVFNYIYQCYLELKQRNYIRECCDQKKLMREFSSNASSVYSFYDSYRLHYSGQTVPTSEVWQDYVNWCRTSLIPLNEIKKNKTFQSEFLRLIEATGAKRVRARIGKNQQYCYVFAEVKDTESEYDTSELVVQEQPQPETLPTTEDFMVTAQPEISTESKETESQDLEFTQTLNMSYPKLQEFIDNLQNGNDSNCDKRFSYMNWTEKNVKDPERLEFIHKQLIPF